MSEAAHHEQVGTEVSCMKEKDLSDASLLSCQRLEAGIDLSLPEIATDGRSRRGDWKLLVVAHGGDDNLPCPNEERHGIVQSAHRCSRCIPADHNRPIGKRLCRPRHQQHRSPGAEQRRLDEAEAGMSERPVSAENGQVAHLGEGNKPLP